MTSRLLTKRVANLADLRTATIDETSLPFAPQDLAHVYIKLDFKKEHENAKSAEDARAFLSSVARASLATHLLAELYGGMVLEVQGGMIHAALPNNPTSAQDFAANVHRAYGGVFDKPDGRVQGWRMAADGGRTLVVAGRGVHGDDSYVSLGRSANRPAKHIYAQLELPEAQRSLKRFCLGMRDPLTDRWKHTDLNVLRPSLAEAVSIANSARTAQPQLEFRKALRAPEAITARTAAPMASSSPDRPHTYFGWVMRCDLDGFTSRVEECFDDDQRLQELAAQFYAIMDEAAQFVSRHAETLAQLPWAGDNFTVAALSETREAYAEASTHRTVELPLDFEEEMRKAAVRSGFGGWAHSVAGGKVHGRSNGNVYIGNVTVGDRRYMVGVGEGFGRSTQGFSDVSPDPTEIVLYKDDWSLLDEPYQQAFKPATTVANNQSSLYMIANAEAVLRVLARREAVGAATVVTVAPGKKDPVSGRPHAK